MKILLCSITYPLPNGVTNSVNESIDGFLAAGHEVRIVAPDYGNGLARPEHVQVRSSLVGRAFVQLFGKEERVFGLGSARAIRELIVSFQPDAFWLHTLTWAPSAFERVMLKSPQPKVLTYHTMVAMYGRLYGGVLGEDQMIRRSMEVGNAVDHIIAPSQFVSKTLRTYGVKKPITVISTGIAPFGGRYSKAELAKRYGFSPKNNLLLNVGRVVKEKNIAALLTILKTLLPFAPNTTLLLVGPGEIDEMKSLANDLGVRDHVIFTGPIAADESRKFYPAADVFVFASLSETQGLVTGEAMSAGVPVVALQSSVSDEACPSGTAIVVQKENELAPTVLQLLQDPVVAKKLALAGQKFVTEHYSKKEMIKKQLGVFEELTTPH